jgi:hypothetical protein
LPFGFPAVRDLPSVAQPAGLSVRSPSTSPKAEVAELSAKPEAPAPGGARYSNSLAPLARDTKATVEPRALGMWGDRSVVLASEYRAVKATSKRRALWAALGSAAIASVVTLRLVHTSALRTAETTPFRAVPVAAQAPEPATSIDAVARPIASQVAPPVTTVVPNAIYAAPKPVAQPRRTKTPAATSPSAPASSTRSQAEVASAPSASAAIAVPGALPSAMPLTGAEANAPPATQMVAAVGSAKAPLATAPVASSNLNLKPRSPAVSARPAAPP